MKVLTFGITKDIIGSRSLEVPSNLALTVGELRQYVISKYPKMEKIKSLAIAVNEEYATDDKRLNESDVVALIPPVSGG